MRSVGCGIAIAVAVFMFLLLDCGGLLLPLVYLAFGWLHFPFVAVPKMTVEPVAAVVGCASLVLLTAVSHGFAGWLYAHARRDQALRPAWRLRWTTAIVPIIVLLFAASICLIVVIHQVAWLVTTHERIFEPGAVRTAARRSQSGNNLHEMGVATLGYVRVQDHLPPGGTFDLYGNPLHSWETLLLPYMESLIRPEMALSWNHPQNSDHFKIPTRLSPHRNPSGMLSGI